MKYSQGQFVNYKRENGKTDICLVAKGRGNNFLLIFFNEETNDLRQFSVDPNSLTMSKMITLADSTQAPHPLLVKEKNKRQFSLKKGEYVSITGIDTNERLFGVILRGASGFNMATMAIKNEKLVMQASACSFTKEGTAPEVIIPNELKNWSFKFKAYPNMSEETVCFDATVLHNGKIAFYAKNNGCGGCMQEDGDIGLIKQFNDSVNASIIRLFPDENKRPSMYEMGEQYILWFNQRRAELQDWDNYLSGFIFNK